MSRPAMVLVLAVAGLLAACSAGGNATPSQAATARQTAEPTIGALFHRSGTAGRYHSASLEPEVVMTLPDGWNLFFDDKGGVYMGIPDGEFLVGRPSQVIDPKSQTPAPVPEDLLAWLTKHPQLKATQPTAIEISGLDAAYVEIDPKESVDVFYDPLGNFHVGPGPVARFYVLPWAGTDFFVAVLKAESGGSLHDALELGAPIAESLEIVE